MNITINIDVLRGIVLSTTKNGVETNAIIDRVLAISNLDAAQSGVVSFLTDPKEVDPHELNHPVHPIRVHKAHKQATNKDAEHLLTEQEVPEYLDEFEKGWIRALTKAEVHPDRVHKAHKQAINKDAEWREWIEKRILALEEDNRIIPAGKRYTSDFGFVITVTSDTPEGELSRAAADAYKEGRMLTEYPERK